MTGFGSKVQPVMQQGCKKETISIYWGRTSNLEDHLSEEVVVSNPPLRSFGCITTPDISRYRLTNPEFFTTS